MERIAAEITDGAQRFAFILAHHALRRVFHHHQTMAMGNIHDGIHLAGHTGVVHHHQHLGLIGDGCLDLGLVNIHRIGADVHKHQLGTGQHRRGGRAGKSIAGQDHFVPGLQPAEQHCHIQRRGAAGGQQHLLGSKPLFHPSITFFRKGTVAADFMRIDGLFDIVDLVPDTRRNIKRNHG